MKSQKSKNETPEVEERNPRSRKMKSQESKNEIPGVEE
jgi:hypothetical protein